MRIESWRDSLWRWIKVMPVVGYFFVLAAAPLVLRRKGYLLGCLAITLDILPVICLIKAGVESFTGDLIPDKPEEANGIEVSVEPLLS